MDFIISENKINIKYIVYKKLIINECKFLKFDVFINKIFKLKTMQ